MTGRYMRVIVFFDLPVDTSAGRNAYTRFRKFLVKDGFFMRQESVYCKLAANLSAANTIISQIKNNAPEAGLIQVLTITEKQYSNMELIIGESESDIVNSTDRIIVI